ncbi:hypothetical protein HYC85_000538 [Camellia sinensis]|uniref:Uncharacterized protein n=1 Tax=Camellia sinensis TaxID=4442 RepID=A0A7J7I321_CAMSI|nr:hypothetical protein HYC85_000538 [Camellia sinensis]
MDEGFRTPMIENEFMSHCQEYVENEFQTVSIPVYIYIYIYIFTTKTEAVESTNGSPGLASLAVH